MKKMTLSLDCRVEVDGKMGKVIRTSVLGLSSSKGVVIQYDDGSTRMFINEQMDCIREH